MKKILIISISAMCCAAALGALFFYSRMISKGEIVSGWRHEFSGGSIVPAGIPKGWVLKAKPGAKPAVFSEMKDTKTGESFLRMEADRASASLITKPDSVDIKKTPLLRWHWRAATLPEGADGRIKAKDDQAIGIYAGTGNILNNKCVSYRWDTETPKGSEGNSAYGFGRIKVKWYTLRNKEDNASGRWYTEERNIAEDFKKAWGFYPKTIYLSISCNSQYTGSLAAADLAWIEFAVRKQ